MSSSRDWWRQCWRGHVNNMDKNSNCDSKIVFAKMFNTTATTCWKFIYFGSDVIFISILVQTRSISYLPRRIKPVEKNGSVTGYDQFTWTINLFWSEFAMFGKMLCCIVNCSQPTWSRIAEVFSFQGHHIFLKTSSRWHCYWRTRWI